MLQWRANYWVTLTIALVLAAVVTLIVVKLVKDRKRGKTSCGCNCAHCAMAGSCHSNKKP